MLPVFFLFTAIAELFFLVKLLGFFVLLPDPGEAMPPLAFFLPATCAMLGL